MYTVHTCAHGIPRSISTTITGELSICELGLTQTKWVKVAAHRSKSKAIADADSRSIRAVVMSNGLAVTEYDNGKTPHDNPHGFAG